MPPCQRSGVALIRLLLQALPIDGKIVLRAYKDEDGLARRKRAGHARGQARLKLALGVSGRSLTLRLSAARIGTAAMLTAIRVIADKAIRQ